MDLKFENPGLGQLLSGFKSKHFGTDEKFNENNDGIGYMNNDGYLGGMYKNSLGKTSLYGGKEFKTNLIDNLVDVGLILGLVSGYGGIKPMALPEAILKNGNSEYALGLVPPIPNVTPATLALQYRKKF